ncbi:MAG: FtsX-like permease family protein [Fimbriimonas sp.]|nr:FtsX-like permease family protein [Fimbriimonas sp.]
MRTLLFRYSFKHHRAHRLRLAMVILSLALGVAIFVSSYESIVAAQNSIEASAKTMAGKTKWQVSRGRFLGIEEALVERIRRIPNAIAAPIIESTVSTAAPHGHSFLLIGLDLDSDSLMKLYGGEVGDDLSSIVALKMSPSSVLVPMAYARKFGLRQGAWMTLQTNAGPKRVVVAGLLRNPRMALAAGGSVGFMELHAAQDVLGTLGLVDRIDVAGVSRADLMVACPQCQVVPPGQLSSAAGDALGRIHSLLGVSVIALLVGVLLIYNSVQVSVLERLKDIAIIRAVGATKLQVFAFLLAEWFVIGLVGSTAGIGLGYLLAYELIEYTKRTVNSMVPLIGEAHVSIDPAFVAAGLVVGIGTALIAAFFPIWTAAHVRPLEILRPYTFRRKHRYFAAACAGIAICVVGNFIIADASMSMAVGLCVTGMVFLGVALLFPQVVLGLSALGRPWLVKIRRPEPYLALDGLIKTPHRTAFTIMTFGCALAMTVATETLVEGFRVSTGQWMNSAFPFDISIVGNDLASSVYGNSTLAVSSLTGVRQVPGVSLAYGVRQLLTPFKGADVMAIGVDTQDYLDARKARQLGDWPSNFGEPGIKSAFTGGSGAFVTANFEALYHLHKGDRMTFVSPSGPVELKVLSVIDDYSWSHGAIIVDRELLKKRWRDDLLSYIDVSIARGASLDDVKGRVAIEAGKDRSAFAYDRREIRQVTDSVLEQAVQMANLQAMIAVVIGMLGIVNAIWIGVMNRRREIALWRCIGVSRRQVTRIILFEGLFVSVVAAVLGALGGLYGGWVPLRIFSFEITGYIYPMVVPWLHVLAVAALALVLGLLAGLPPALHAAKLPILDAIGYE